MWDFLWIKWHWNRFSSEYFSFVCQYYYINAPHSSSSKNWSRQKDKGRSLGTFQKAVLFRKSGCGRYKSTFTSSSLNGYNSRCCYLTIFSMDSTEIFSQRQSSSHTERSQSKNHFSLDSGVFLLSTLQVPHIVHVTFSAPYIMERNANKKELCSKSSRVST